MTIRPVCATEKALEKLVADSLWRFNFHNDPTTIPGIPDRYVVGGIWIEFKNESTFDKTSKSLNRQRRWLSLLDNARDKPYVCALINELLYFESWRTWRQREAHKIGRVVKHNHSPFLVNNQRDIIFAVQHAQTYF